MPEYIEPEITLISTGLTGEQGRTVVNGNFTNLQNGITGLRTDTAATFNTLIGVGRIVGTDTTEGQPVAGTGLSLLIPDATSFLINGTIYTVDGGDTGYISITGVPAFKSSGVYGYLSADEDGVLQVLPEHWYETLPEDAPEGLPVLAKVFTSSNAVTSISYTLSDLVQSQSTILGRLEALEASGGSSGSGSGSGGSVGDLTALQNQLNAALARITALENAANDGVVAVASESENSVAELLRMMAHVVHISPELAGEVNSAIEIPGLTGDGELWANGEAAPTVYAGGNATRNPSTRRVE